MADFVYDYMYKFVYICILQPNIEYMDANNLSMTMLMRAQKYFLLTHSCFQDAGGNRIACMIQQLKNTFHGLHIKPQDAGGNRIACMVQHLKVSDDQSEEEQKNFYFVVFHIGIRAPLPYSEAIRLGIATSVGMIDLFNCIYGECGTPWSVGILISQDSQKIEWIYGFYQGQSTLIKFLTPMTQQRF
ncbi:hypothetical protein ACJX0J_041002 [Zea mays]